MEDEEHLLTFYAFLEDHASVYSHDERHRKLFHHRNVLSDHRVGRYARNSCAQDPCELMRAS